MRHEIYVKVYARVERWRNTSLVYALHLDAGEKRVETNIRLA